MLIKKARWWVSFFFLKQKVSLAAWYNGGQGYMIDKEHSYIIYFNGSVTWFKNNNIHRLFGPAIINKLGANKEYYIDGVRLSKNEWSEQLAIRGKNASRIKRNR